MYYLSFKNRIALTYIISTAVLVALAFFTIFLVVEISVANNLKQDLENEAERHLKEVVVREGAIALRKHEEWMQREHNTVGVDPVFIEFLDAEGKLIDKSPNLKESQLSFTPNREEDVFIKSELADKKIKQVQMSIFNNGEKVGYLLVAVSIEGAEIVLHTLRNILLFIYPFILLILFFAARIIAGKSISPINDIIYTSSIISQDNLASRIPLPNNKDELYILSETINNLLDRVKHTIEREKSFTSYASHEFRTPLAILKGTLEVLIRKPRQTEEYVEKVNFCIDEIDRLNKLVDELLILTRFENQKTNLNLEYVSLEELITVVLERFSNPIQTKKIEINTSIPSEIHFKTDTYLFSIILNNILSNAIKYSHSEGKININAYKESGKTVCLIKDNGIGISEKDINKVFDKFYRSYADDHPEIKGFGLGLSIVKQLSFLLQIEMNIYSIKNKGTEIRLIIPT